MVAYRKETKYLIMGANMGKQPTYTYGFPPRRRASNIGIFYLVFERLYTVIYFR